MVNTLWEKKSKRISFFKVKICEMKSEMLRYYASTPVLDDGERALTSEGDVLR